MKVFKRVGARRLLVLAPLALLIILAIAISGPITSGGAYGLGEPLPPPVPGFTPAPLPGPGSFNSIILVSDLDALLANDANHGNTGTTPNVHIIDVRSNFEYLSDVCPMQIALGLPLYTDTNTGHPVWNWPDSTYEEAISDPYWIGYHWAGVPFASLWNLRMQENPNFAHYLNALVADGMIKQNDKLVFLCQPGYRASWAAYEAAQMGFTDAEVLHGGMLAWEDDWEADDGLYCDDLPTDPSPDDAPGYTDTDPYTDDPLIPNCDPDNTPGPAARPRAFVMSAPWQYDTARLALVGAPVVWNGTEPHVGVKAEWLPPDNKLAPSTAGAFWASMADYTAGILSVNVKLTNTPPDPPGPMNYPAGCGGAPPPGGSCENVNQAPHGTAYSTTVVYADATNGVTPAVGALPAPAGDIAANGDGIAVVKYQVPSGVTFFRTNVYVTAYDVPDPNAPMGPDYAWYFTYTYPGPPPTP
jgi:rhodanese-related sulfurtransferase